MISKLTNTVHSDLFRRYRILNIVGFLSTRTLRQSGTADGTRGSNVKQQFSSRNIQEHWQKIFNLRVKKTFFTKFYKNIFFNGKKFHQSLEGLSLSKSLLISIVNQFKSVEKRIPSHYLFIENISKSKYLPRRLINQLMDQLWFKEEELPHIPINQEHSGQNIKIEEVNKVVKKLEVRINIYI